MDKKRHMILDGSIEEQDRRFKEWLGLRPDQSYDELKLPEDDEDEKKKSKKK